MRLQSQIFGMKDQVSLGRVELKVFWVGLFRDTLSVQLDALGWGAVYVVMRALDQESGGLLSSLSLSAV